MLQGHAHARAYPTLRDSTAHSMVVSMLLFCYDCLAAKFVARDFEALQIGVQDPHFGIVEVQQHLTAFAIKLQPNAETAIVVRVPAMCMCVSTVANL